MWELVFISPIKNDIGEVTHFVAVKQDISGRKAAEAQVLEYQTQLDLALDAGGIGTWSRSLTDNRIVWDKRTHEIYGTTEEEFARPTDSVFKRVHPEDMEMVREEIAKTRVRKQGHSFSHRLLLPDGRVRHLLVRSQIVDRPAPRVVGVCVDITHFKEAEAALLQAKAEADAASQAKTQFLATMSHELRTPLNAILGYAQILLRDAAPDSKPARALATILRSGEHLLALINDVLDISKVEAGRLELAPKDIALHEFLDNIWAIFRPRYAEKGIDGTLDVSPGVPDAIRADEQKLRQVLVNLLSNAVKFTERGSVRLAVDVLGDQLRFQIVDTGPGIAAADQTQIFDPFTQAGAMDRRSEGTGLGLAIVKRIIELMGGSIELISEVGRGSTFAVVLPMVAASASAAPATGPASSPRRHVGYRGARRRVLVVDDTPENRAVLEDMLQPLGFELRLCKSGAEAIHAVEAWSPDLVFMDLRMPGMDGLEATRILRGSPAGALAKIVVLSASAFGLDREECFRAGCDDFLAKPFREAALLEVIARHLGIEWELASEPEPPSQDVPEPMAAVAPPEVVESLLEMLKRGDMRRVAAEAAALAERDRTLAPFATRVAELAAEFKVKALREWLAELAGQRKEKL